MKKMNGQIDFFLKEFGQDVLLNGNSKKVIISDATTKPNYYDEKFIRTDVTYDTGTLFEYQNEKWMVISQIIADKNTFKAKIRRADWKISFYIQNVLYSFYGIADNLDVSLQEGKVISNSAGEIKLIFQAGDDTNNLAIDQRFIKFGAAWKITGIDKSKKGLHIVYAKKDLFNQYDDKDNEIADRWSHEVKHIYTIDITDNNPITFEIGEIQKLNYKVFDNGTLMEVFPEVIFTVENEVVATIDSTGNISALSEGTTTICCKLKEMPTIKADCKVQVVKAVVKEYTISITYTVVELTLGGGARTFTANVNYGGTLVTDKIVKWSVKNIDNTETTMVVLTDKGSNKCTVKAKEDYSNIGKKIILIAELSDNSNVKNEVTIKLVM